MTLERLLQIDRRVIFALMALAVAIPLITGITFDPGQTPPTKAIYDYIQDMKPGSVLVIVFDYGPASMPELDPMAAALIRHGLTRGLRVVGLTLDIQGAVLGDDVLNRVGRGMGKESGVDYVNLGYQPGYTAVILGMGEDIGKVFQTDFAGRPYGELRITKGLRTFKDIGLIIDLDRAGPRAVRRDRGYRGNRGHGNRLLPLSADESTDRSAERDEGRCGVREASQPPRLGHAGHGGTVDLPVPDHRARHLREHRVLHLAPAATTAGRNRGLADDHA